ncbi:MAG: amidophosphoribosyltransferase [Candidatus Pacebacteria bacterium]|nr:amidophosphoribosyltransferase [Candidatus Paceibacterota bacterium]
MNSTEKPREYCGLCGVTGSESALEQLHLGLHALQHRGQEAAGIMAVVEGRCRLHRGIGLVDDVFRKIPESWRNESLSRGIAHVRYSTAGSSSVTNAQPLMVDVAGEVVGIAHNGTICNAQSLRRELQNEGAIFQTSSDTELVVHLMARSLMKRHKGDLWEALEEALQQLRGAYCFLLMTRDHVVAVRDPHGFRPLAVADFCDGSYMIASETISFDVTGAKYVREVEPGEMIVWGPNSRMESRMFAESPRRAHCIFEHVYFARPGSYVFGDSVYEVRKAMGRRLAEEAPVDADLIVPVPDSGMFAGLGYAEASGIPFDMGFTRNHYVGRTFIDPGLVSRRGLVTRKLQPIAEAVRGKRICLIEDSIVRGSTSRARIHTLREVGAQEVHMRVSCPPHRYGCYFGIDFPEKDALLANKVPLDDLCASLRLDSLAYLSKEGMLSCVSKYNPEDYCCACFDGQYPVEPDVRDQPPLPVSRKDEG